MRYSHRRSSKRSLKRAVSAAITLAVGVTGVGWFNAAGAVRDDALSAFADVNTAIDAKTTDIQRSIDLRIEVGSRVTDLSTISALIEATTDALNFRSAVVVPSRIGLFGANGHLEAARVILEESEYYGATLAEAIQNLSQSHQRYLSQSHAANELVMLDSAASLVLAANVELAEALSTSRTMLTSSHGRVDDDAVRTTLATTIDDAETFYLDAIQQTLGLTAVSVVRVIDGDTIEVEYHHGIERVRLIGVDTPERGEPGHASATAFTQSQIESVGNWVYLQQNGIDRDVHGRLRRCVFLAEGTGLLNAMLIANGYGIAAEQFGNCDGEVIAAQLQVLAGQQAEAEASLSAASVAVEAAMASRTARLAEAARLAAERQAAAQSAAEQQSQASVSSPAASGGASHGVTRFRNCTHVWQVLGRPIRRGEAGFHSALDRDNDGVGCERRPR